MIFKCPLCDFDGDVCPMPDHLERHGILLVIDGTWRCACLDYATPDGMMNTLLFHACNEHSDWPRILTRKALESF